MCANDISASFKFMRTPPQSDRDQRKDSMKSKTKQACYGSKQMKRLLGLFRIWWPQSIIWNFESNIYYEQVQTIELSLNTIQQWLYVSTRKFRHGYNKRTMYVTRKEREFSNKFVDSISMNQHLINNVGYLDHNAKTEYSEIIYEMLTKQPFEVKPHA